MGARANILRRNLGRRVTSNIPSHNVAASHSPGLRSYPGSIGKNPLNPEGDVSNPRDNPFRVGAFLCAHTQGSSYLATLGWQTHPLRGKPILQRLASFDQMERGTLSVLRQTPHGPCCNLQRRENGRHLSEYIPAEQVPLVEANLATTIPGKNAVTSRRMPPSVWKEPAPPSGLTPFLT